MQERRKSKRLPMEAVLELERIDENGVATIRHVRVDVSDLSKTGIGFHCEQELEIGSFYDTRLVIWTKEVIETVIRVVRRVDRKIFYEYGANFVGMTDADAFKIEVYQLFHEAEEKDDQ